MGIEPITRKEMFMASAAGESVSTLTPVTREEYFLSKIGGGGGGGGTQSDLSQTDITQPDYVKGVIRQESLPDGYPYKEVVTIEWDGNTDGLDVVSDFYYRVSDAIVSDEQIKAGVMMDGNGNEETVASIASWDTLVSMGYVTEDVVYLESIVFVRKDSAVLQGVTFNKIGVYFGPLVRKFITETIHPMAPEFLPALTSPNGTKYQLTVADNGTLSAVKA